MQGVFHERDFLTVLIAPCPKKYNCSLVIVAHFDYLLSIGGKSVSWRLFVDRAHMMEMAARSENVSLLHLRVHFQNAVKSSK